MKTINYKNQIYFFLLQFDVLSFTTQKKYFVIENMFLFQMLLSQTSKERRLYIFTFVNQGLKLNHFATRHISTI